MNKTVVAIIATVIAAAAQAEPLPDFEMRQYLTNDPTSMPPAVGIEVTGILLTNGMTQASNLVAELEADPDYFGGDIAYDANIHWHDHLNPSLCWFDFVASHRSKKDPLKKYTIIEEEIDNPARYIPQRWILPATDKNDAKRKEKKVQDRDKTKKWKPRKDHDLD